MVCLICLPCLALAGTPQVGKRRQVNESDKKNLFLRDLCVLERPAGAGERKNKLSFSHYEAEGLWD